MSRRHRSRRQKQRKKQLWQEMQKRNARKEGNADSVKSLRKMEITPLTTLIVVTKWLVRRAALLQFICKSH